MNNPLEEKLLQLAAAGKSGEEMESVTGVNAAKCITIVQNILKSKDPWTYQEKKQLILHDLISLKNDIQTTIDAMGGLIDPKLANVLITTLKNISEILDKQEALNGNDLKQITKEYTNAMVIIIDNSFYSVRKELEKYSDVIDLHEIDGIFQSGLKEGVLEVESK